MIEIKELEMSGQPKILVIGVGGGGNNAVNRMVSSAVTGVSFANVNTDKFVLEKSITESRIQIGAKLLSGYGAGANPEVGESAAIESEEEIRSLVQKYGYYNQRNGWRNRNGCSTCDCKDLS